MSDFMKALEKTDPEILSGPKKEEQEKGSTMSFQDMKDYFDAMKESLLSTMKKDMDDYMKQVNNKPEQNEAPEQKEKEGNEDASSSDL